MVAEVAKTYLANLLALSRMHELRSLQKLWA